MYYNTKKQKPGLVAFHDVRPGNGVGPISKEKIRGGISKEKMEKKMNKEAFDL